MGEKVLTTADEHAKRDRMDKKPKGDDLPQVIREERRRGRRPVDEAVLREKLLLIKELLAEEDETVFLDAIRALGLQDGSEAWTLALKAWRDAWRER